jgi:hypothetical protein
MNDGGAVVKFFDGVAIAQEPLLARAHPIHRDVHSLRAKQEPPMRAQLAKIAIVAAALLGLVFLVQPAAAHKQSGATLSSADASALRTAMRKLWEDHVTWTRNYIVSALAGLDDASAVAERLLKNQDDIGAAIIPYYGEAAGKKLAQLLRDHILIAADVVSAAKAGNGEQLSSAQQKWQSNGDDIAAFLSAANPHWGKEETRSMLSQHLTFTTNEVVARLKKDWAADIKAYDDGHVHMLMFADTLADGIARQFPAKIKRTAANSQPH